MSRIQRFLCGVPDRDCQGAHTTTHEQGGRKTHSSREEARKCYFNYLRGQGYRQVGDNPSHWQRGEGPVLVVTKVSQFGSVMRKGKEGRVMFDRTSGTIIKQ